MKGDDTMIPSLGLMVWAYGVARLVEILMRKGERKPHYTVMVLIIIMLLVMCFSCVNMNLSGGDSSNPAWMRR
jgi:hypothetical protein